MTKIKRIAIQHPYAHGMAESESSARIILAAQRLGIDAKECKSPDEVIEYQPDFVLALSHQDAKMTPFPTYGVMTQPVNYYHMSGRLLHNTLTYDGYLTTSKVITQWIKDINFGARKKPIIGHYATTVSAYDFTPPDLTSPHLVYLGSNWDGTRFKDLLVNLSMRQGMRFYGREEGWKHIHPDAYCGPVDFDGTSVLDVYRNAGVGLCLLLSDFTRDELFNNRLFEIPAASAITICSRHPYIEEIYGDSILYIDIDAPVETILEQIDAHMLWIQENPEAAVELARRSHEIYNQKLSMDVLLPNVLALHDQVMKERYQIRAKWVADHTPDITCIMRTGNRPKWLLERSVGSIAQQTHQNVRILYVPYTEQEGLDEVIAQHPNIDHVISPKIGGRRSDTLWHGISEIKTPYFAILDDDDEIFPRHYETLLDTFRRNSGLSAIGDVGVAYSGSLIVTTEPKQLKRTDDFDVPRFSRYAIEQFSPFFPNNFTNLRLGIGPYSCLISSDLIDEDVLENPHMDGPEDAYLLRLLATKKQFAFSWELSSVHHMHGIDQTDPYDNYDDLARAVRRLHDRTYHGSMRTNWHWYDMYNSALSEERRKEFERTHRLNSLLTEKGLL